MKDTPISVALIDYRLKEEDGITTSKILRSENKNIKTIILTGFPSYERAVESMKAGIFDYISKGTSNKKIISVIDRAVNERRREMMSKGELDEDEHCVKLILICDHSHIRDRLESITNNNPDLKLMKAFHSIEDLKRSKFAKKIDIVLVCPDSLGDFGNDTSHFFAELPGLIPSAKPVIINEDLKDEDKVYLIMQGAKGFCSIDSDSDRIDKALQLVKEGQIWAEREITGRSIQALIKERPVVMQMKTGEDNTFGLTDREKEILRAVITGLKNKEIANTMSISEPTVKTHINRIYKKLGVDNRSKAILKALEDKVLE